MTTDFAHADLDWPDRLVPLRARLRLEADDPATALRAEAVMPIGFCGCMEPDKAPDVPGCLRCGARLRRGTPWVPR